MAKAKQNKGAKGARKGVVTAAGAKPTVVNLRGNMPFKISTTSLTASGVTPIRGATKYPDQPSIYFTREAWVKQCHLVRKCSKEVGWFALVDHDEEHNTFTITELVIPCQEVTAAETDIGKEDLADAAMELIEAGKDTSKMYAWFHSHVNMGVSPSAQDEYQVEDFLKDLADQPEVPAFIRGIQNKAGELKLDVYYVQHGVAYQNLDFTVIHDDDPQWLKDIDAQILTKVTERTYQNYGGYGGGHHDAGKRQSAAGIGYSAAANNRPQNGSHYSHNARGYGWDGYDMWDDYDYTDDNAKAVEMGAAVDDRDSPALKAVDIPYMEYSEMDIVYQLPGENIEVLLDANGHLWVCDDEGSMFDYDDYTEVYGELGGLGDKATTTIPEQTAVLG